jgi:acetyltransferase-like isoleucine patch superfamily enzyme
VNARSVLANVHRAALGIASRGRSIYYRSLGVRIQGQVWLRSISITRNWSDITLEAGVALDEGVSIVVSGPAQENKVVIGAKTYINRYTILDAHRRLHIGRRVMIGPHCYITDANHGMNSTAPIPSQEMDVAPVIIEDDAWLGAHVTVLAGVRIGKGAIVGAGAVVTRNVAPMAVVAGVPARLLRSRDELEIERPEMGQAVSPDQRKR